MWGFGFFPCPSCGVGDPNTREGVRNCLLTWIYSSAHGEKSLLLTYAWGRPDSCGGTKLCDPACGRSAWVAPLVVEKGLRLVEQPNSSSCRITQPRQGWRSKAFLHLYGGRFCATHYSGLCGEVLVLVSLYSGGRKQTCACVCSSYRNERRNIIAFKGKSVVGGSNGPSILFRFCQWLVTLTQREETHCEILCL